MKIEIKLNDATTICLLGTDTFVISDNILTTLDGRGDVITLSMKDVEIINIT